MFSDVSKRRPRKHTIIALQCKYYRTTVSQNVTQEDKEKFEWQHLYLKNFQTCVVLQTAAPFKISIELEKDVFVSSGAWDKETILSPHKESRKELQDRPLHNRPHSPQSLCGSVVEHQRTESRVLRFDSSWRFRIFSLSQACEKRENIFLYFFNKLKTNHLSYSIYIELADHREHTEATKPYALVSGFT